MCCKTNESGCGCSSGKQMMSKKKKIDLATQRIGILKEEIKEIEEYIEELRK